MINIGNIMETVVISTSGGQGASTCGRADVNRKKGRMVVPKTGHLSSAYHCNQWSLMMMVMVMMIDDGDAVVASQTRLSAILFLQTCRQAAERYVM